VHRRRANDRLVRQRKLDGRQQERLRLGPADAAVE
jgi:hypothetical protein